MDRWTNKIYQPLRFYTDNVSKIHLRHDTYGYKNIVPLVASRTQLIPFELFRSVTTPAEWVEGAMVTDIYVVNFKTNVETRVTRYLTLYFGQRVIAPSDYEMYISYKGNSTIPALNQGLYYIHAIMNTDGTTPYHLYSDLFKVGFYSTIDIEFKNSYSFGNLWMRDFYWKASYEGQTYDPAEYSEYAESNKDDDNFDKFTYQRIDKLRAVSLLVDSHALDTLKMSKMCDEVYITDELSRERIEIIDISGETFNKSNYITAVLKYRVVTDSVISVNKESIIYMGSQYSTGGLAPAVTLDDGSITFDGEPITFGGQNITFNN